MSFYSHCFFLQALKAECREEEAVASDKDVCPSNNHTETPQPAAPINTEDVHAPSVSCNKSAGQNPQSIDCTHSSNTNRLPPEEENQSDGEGVVNERVDTQQAEMLYPASEQEPQLASPAGIHTPGQWRSCDGQGDNVLNKSDGLDDDVSEEVVRGEDLDTAGAGEVVGHSPQLDERGEEIEQQEEVYLECSGEDDGAGRGKDEMAASGGAVLNSEGCDGSSVSLSGLSDPVKVEVGDDGPSGVTQISGTTDFPGSSAEATPPPNDDIEPTILVTQIPSEEVPENNRDGSSMVLTEEWDDPRGQSCFREQKSFGQEGIKAPHPDTADDEPANAEAEDMPRHSPSVSEDRQSNGIENDDSPAADADTPSRLTARITSEDLPQPDMMPSSRRQQSSLVEDEEELSEGTSFAAPAVTGSSPPVCQIQLASSGESEQRNNGVASPGVGEESGISSLAVSPDSQDTGIEFDVANDHMVDSDPESEEQTEPQNGLFADDAASSFFNDAGVEFGPYPSLCFHVPHGSFGANEDMFGHEIEDGYHRVIDHFTTQISTSFSRFTDDLTIQTDVKTIIEVVEIKEEVKTGESIKQGEGTKADEQEEDSERTEISIMEATMDYNEWITDCSYPVLPWLNLPVPSFGQDHAKPNQLPNETGESNAAVPDVIHTTYTEVKRTSTLSPMDEITESSKRVVAVQPMPQNVNVTFKVHYFTESPHQTVAVTGNQQELGNWKGFVPLEGAKDGNWTTVVSLPTESRVEWKFVVLDKGEVCRWEECDNRLLDTGSGDQLLVHKWWGLL